MTTHCRPGRVIRWPDCCSPRGDTGVEALAAFGKRIMEEEQCGKITLTRDEVARMIERGGSRTEAGRTIAEHGVLIIINTLDYLFYGQHIFRVLAEIEPDNRVARLSELAPTRKWDGEWGVLAYIAKNAPDEGTRTFAAEQLTKLVDLEIKLGETRVRPKNNWCDSGLSNKPPETKGGPNYSKFVDELEGMLPFGMGIQLTQRVETEGPMQ